LEKIEEKDGTAWNAQRSYKKENVIKPEAAYEVHSCLVDALETGTGKAARPEFGLKKFPAGGKTGTAYDFTDALFAGYDNNFTCAVWAGFDKPQKIYRGAFGREIALPVWVDVMNAAAAHYPPKEIKRPPNLKEVEICTRSGLLATDKCYDTVKSATGDPVQKRTTSVEIGTKEQIPTELCNVHGEARPRMIADSTPPPSEAPRAQPAADLSEVRPIALRSPTLITENDPYNSVKATVKIQSADEEPVAEAQPAQKIDSRPENQNPADVRVERAAPVTAGEDGKPVLRAIPVQPEAEETPVEVRRALPVGPMDEVEEGALLKAASPSPGQPENQ
jgi:penicillin-binding protein 1A